MPGLLASVVFRAQACGGGGSCFGRTISNSCQYDNIHDFEALLIIPNAVIMTCCKRSMKTSFIAIPDVKCPIREHYELYY